MRSAPPPGTHTIPLAAALAQYLNAFAANLISVAVRLVPLGQTDGLTTLSRLQPAILATAERATASTLDELGSATILSDIAAMRHETHLFEGIPLMTISPNGPLRVGIGGPVGAGKTTLTEVLCKALRDRYSLAVVTNDIFTVEDALILNRVQALPEERILGVETGGCPHTAIREDASINLAAIARCESASRISTSSSSSLAATISRRPSRRSSPTSRST